MRLNHLEITRSGDLTFLARLPQLRTLALENVATCKNHTPLQLSVSLVRFTDLGAFVFTVAADSSTLPHLHSLPPSIKYLMVSSSAGIDDWLRVAARDCKTGIDTLRIMPVEGDMSRITPSREAIRLISQLGR